MTPLIPPPPICAPRRFHDAGRMIRKLIMRAVGAVSTGANTPSTRQWAGTASVAATHAACRLTLRTGSPISFGGIVATSEGALQPASVATRLSSLGLDAGCSTPWSREDPMSATHNAARASVAVDFIVATSEVDLYVESHESRLHYRRGQEPSGPRRRRIVSRFERRARVRVRQIVEIDADVRPGSSKLQDLCEPHVEVVHAAAVD